MRANLPTRLHVIMNPVSGRGAASKTLDQLQCFAGEAGNIPLIVHETGYCGHARAIVCDLGLEPNDALCVLGGDGTMHEVVEGLMSRSDGQRAPIGLVPCGTGNSLMHDLGLLDSGEAYARMFAGKRSSLDLMQLSSATAVRWSFNAVGWGLAGEAARQAEVLRWIGNSRYQLATLFQVLAHKDHRMNVTLDDEALPGSYILAVACNTQHTGHAMRVVPDAERDDGLVDVLLVKPASRSRLLSVLGRLSSGRHLDSPLVQVRRATSLSVSSVGYESPIVIDGEMASYEPLSLEMLPRARELLA